MPRCTDSITLETLADYYHDDLSDREAAALEEHLFECDECTRRLEALIALGRGVRRLARAGHVPFVLTDALRAQLAADGAHLREFHLEPGASVPCGAATRDDLVVLRLVADLSGVEHANLVLHDDAGIFALEQEDIPVGAARDTVSVAYPGELIRGLPDLTVHVRLSERREGGERAIAEYTLLHSHDGPPPDA